jgi:hypothetical protein
MGYISNQKHQSFFISKKETNSKEISEALKKSRPTGIIPGSAAFVIV